MKKRILYVWAMLTLLSGTLFLSSCSSDGDGDAAPKVVISPVQTIGVDYGDGVEP